jgi:DNA-binding response OmpR family regulator
LIVPRFVLVVEPDERALSAIVSALRHAGYQVTGVCSFDDAHRHLGAARVDVLVSRAVLGALHAIHLAQVLHFVNQGASIVILGDEPDVTLERQLAAMNGMLVPSRISLGALVSLVAMLADPGPFSSTRSRIARTN